MKRRITKIGHPIDCYHCGQLVEYPNPHFEASPGHGTDPETFCSAKCHSLACTNKEGRVTVTDSPNRPRAIAEPTIRSNTIRVKATRTEKRRVAEARRREVIANAIRTPKPGR